MTDALAHTKGTAVTHQPKPEKPPWGVPHDLRGKNYADAAIKFIAAFPLDQGLTADDFDDWAQKAGLLNVPTGAPKASDAWKAHLQRRHELRYRINKAGTHPRMTLSGSTPFTIDCVSMNHWVVRTPRRAIGENKLPRKIETLVSGHRRRLSYLMQSEDWTAMPVEDRILAAGLFEEINYMAEDTDRLATRLSDRFAKLEARIRKAVESGEIKPRNGGITGLLFPHDDDPQDQPIVDEDEPETPE